MSVTAYIHKRWELCGDRHGDVNVIDVEKKRFAYRIWKEDYETNQKRQERNESGIKDVWNDIYQVIGFVTVFQGVWFQGVTQLAAQRGCRFSAIPITLSVLVSLTAIVGVYLRLSVLQNLENSLHRVRISSKVLESFISACEREGVHVDFDRTDAAAEQSYHWMHIEFEKLSSVVRIKRFFVLVSLAIVSSLFAWFIHLIMCGL